MSDLEYVKHIDNKFQAVNYKHEVYDRHFDMIHDEIRSLRNHQTYTHVIFVLFLLTEIARLL